MSGFSSLNTFRHGVHPEEYKDQTAGLPIERVPFVEQYVLPLGQHIGAPSRAVVKPKDRVQRGQIIAEPGGFVSVGLHSPVTGKVVAVATRRNPMGALVPSIVIDADPYATQQFEPRPPIDWRAATPNEFVSHVQRAGLVGMGGAAFPSHVKYVLSDDKPVRYLVINGCECEPFLTCDHRIMVERTDRVLRGVEILGARLGVEKSFIGVERNKGDAIEALRKAAAAVSFPVEVTALQVKYPQGSEKMLIDATFGTEVPAGKLPIDVGIVVNNVMTIAALADYFDYGRPLIDRILTVAGPAVHKAANLEVPIGTPVRAVLEHCGGLRPETRQVVMGGPMMGSPMASLDVPVLKGTSGILAFTEKEIDDRQSYPCVKCGRCLDACPNFLNPCMLAKLARAGRIEAMHDFYISDCTLCASCSFSCPSGIPIAQLIKVAKSSIAQQQRREAKK